ncbi:TPA: hypothetical protein SLN68_004339 [Serratia marcescens]|nr:hypothetical protein [Serratia marcescens]HCR2989652.1 hypothetical protein [Serratia marcescens]HCR3014149.1 hypothetical protein [Serratia marcescens]HEI9817908.1 hypothetical protein [Serratia marcescens]
MRIKTINTKAVLHIHHISKKRKNIITICILDELMQVQDCATVRRDPAQQLQLTSVISLMTAQLDGVVERCNQHWLTGECNV